MGFFEDLAKGGVEGIFSGAAKIISSFKADPTVVAAAGAKLAELELEMKRAEMNAATLLSQAQNKVNEIEAASNDAFARRWRPAAGWLGVIGLAYSVIAYPMFTWASVNFGWHPPPALDTNILATLLMGMLGLGTMRSAEKIMGSAK